MNAWKLVFGCLTAGLMLVNCREHTNPGTSPLSEATNGRQQIDSLSGVAYAGLTGVKPPVGSYSGLNSQVDEYSGSQPGKIHSYGVAGKESNAHEGQIDSGTNTLNFNTNGNAIAGIRTGTPIEWDPVHYPVAVSSSEKAIDQMMPVIVRNPVIQSYIWPYSGVEIVLDNDLFSNTDRYYTNGVRIHYRSPALAFWKINSILPVSTRQSMEYNSLELHHAMYTPFTTKEPPRLDGDRPYSSALYLKFTRRSESPNKGITQCASFDIGVIGKAAMGSVLQKGVHAGLPTNDEPLGWETQIGNDIVLNYNYKVIKQLVTTGNFSAYAIGAGSMGSLNTSAETGLGVKTGTDNYFMAPLPADFVNLQQIKGRKWHFIFESSFTTRIVGYNATLNGGLMNKNNVYVLKPNEIERLLFCADAGITVRHGKYGLKLAQYFISNEFKEGKHHFWGQAGINIGF